MLNIKVCPTLSVHRTSLLDLSISLPMTSLRSTVWLRRRRCVLRSHYVQVYLVPQVPVILSNASGQAEFAALGPLAFPEAGDYLLQTWLRIGLPEVRALNGGQDARYNIRWTRNFMHNLIQDCCITFNDLVAARFDNHHLDFWAAFTVPASKQCAYDNMIGNTAALTGGSSDWLPARLDNSNGAATLELPMIFNPPAPGSTCRFPSSTLGIRALRFRRRLFRTTRCASTSSSETGGSSWLSKTLRWRRHSMRHTVWELPRFRAPNSLPLQAFRLFSGMCKFGRTTRSCPTMSVSAWPALRAISSSSRRRWLMRRRSPRLRFNLRRSTCACRMLSRFSSSLSRT